MAAALIFRSVRGTLYRQLGAAIEKEVPGAPGQSKFHQDTKDEMVGFPV